MYACCAIMLMAAALPGVFGMTTLALAASGFSSRLKRATATASSLHGVRGGKLLLVEGLVYASGNAARGGDYILRDGTGSIGVRIPEQLAEGIDSRIVRIRGHVRNASDDAAPVLIARDVEVLD